MTEILAIVPARGGSKSLPRKNIHNFAGHPLLAYSIAAGLQSELVTRTIVSTDDEEIAAIARQYGAETPFLRPSEFAQDNSLDFPLFTHALDWFAEHENYRPEIVVQLRPTTPIRPLDCVDSAVRLLLDHPEADSVRGVVATKQNPYKMWHITPEGSMTPLLSVPGIVEPYNAPRQALPPTYWQTGHIDAIRVSTIYEKNSLSGDVILPLVIDPPYTVDIDTLSDLERAAELVHSGLSMIKLPPPSDVRTKRPIPTDVALVVFDFDGVMTDDRAWVDQDGHEAVMVNRGDGRGISLLKQAGIEPMVLSSEPNPVVEARCRKLKIPCIHGIEDKATALKQILAERNLAPGQVIYMGNDSNDLPCFPLVACAVAPVDAQPFVKEQADVILTRNGGHGAVRELCEILVTGKKKFEI